MIALLDRLAVAGVTTAHSKTFVRAATRIVDEGIASGEVPPDMLRELAAYALMTLYAERLGDTD